MENALFTNAINKERFLNAYYTPRFGFTLLFANISVLFRVGLVVRLCSKSSREMRLLLSPKIFQHNAAQFFKLIREFCHFSISLH